MACPQCTSGNFALQPLIWEQGTHLGGIAGVQQSVEAARLAPPVKVAVAKRTVFLLVAGLVVGPILTNSVGRWPAAVVLAIIALAIGLPLLRDIRWNSVEQPYARRVWDRTFACRACGHRWVNGQVAAPPAADPRFRIATIAALCLLVIGPGLITQRPAELASMPGPASELETVYLHGRMNVRSGPSTSFPAITTVQRGTPQSVGPADANGWAALHGPDGRRLGFVYRRSELMQTYRP